MITSNLLKPSEKAQHGQAVQVNCSDKNPRNISDTLSCLRAASYITHLHNKLNNWCCEYSRLSIFIQPRCEIKGCFRTHCILFGSKVLLNIPNCLIAEVKNYSTTKFQRPFFASYKTVANAFSQTLSTCLFSSASTTILVISYPAYMKAPSLFKIEKALFS